MALVKSTLPFITVGSSLKLRPCIRVRILRKAKMMWMQL